MDLEHTKQPLPPLGLFFGRLCIGLLFLTAGLSLLFDFHGGIKSLEQIGIPEGNLYVIAGIILTLGCSLLIFIGLFTKLATFLLMIFLIPITVLFHAFWTFSGGEQSFQLSLFLKNIAIFGGLLLIWTTGPGDYSLDAIREKRKEENFSNK